MNEHFDKIKQLIADHFGVADDLISPASELSGDLNLSDLEVTDLLALLAKEFMIDLPSNLDVASLRTVSDVVSFIDQYTEDL